MEALKHLDLNNNENIKTHGTQGRVHQSKFIALNAFIKKEKKTKINEPIFNYGSWKTNKCEENKRQETVRTANIHSTITICHVLF